MKVIRATGHYIDRVKLIARNKKISYISPLSIDNTLLNGRLFILVDDFGQIRAFCGLVYSRKYKAYQIKHLCVARKNDSRHGYATVLLEKLTADKTKAFYATPWIDNNVAINFFVKNGFSAEFLFQPPWCCFTKNIKIGLDKKPKV